MPPEVLKLPAGESRAVLRQTATILANGGIAVLPAEGLYGLHACAGIPAARMRLREVKCDARPRPFILLVASTAQARTLCGPLAPAAEERLATLWPAPLTLLLPAAATVDPELLLDGCIALRCPASGFLRDLAARLPGPLLSTSANRAGAPAPASVADLDPGLRAQCDLIVDGGPLSGVSSTIARIDDQGRLAIVRKGAWQPPDYLPS